MKKILKIVGWTLLSLVGVVLIVASVAVYLVFTPERLTPIVRSILPQIVTCQTEIDEADLTFFSTIPEFGVRLKNVAAISPKDGTPNDTLARIESLVATIDVLEFLSNKSVIINKLALDGGKANVFIAADGTTNFDIFPPSEDEDTTTTPLPFDLLSVKSIKIDQFSAQFVDNQSNMQAAIGNFSANIAGSYAENDINGKGKIFVKEVNFALLGDSPMNTKLNEMKFDFDANLAEKLAQGNAQLSLAGIDFAMGNDQFLSQQNVEIALPFSANLDEMSVNLNEAKLRLAEFGLQLDGTAQLADNDIVTDINFATETWNLERLIALIPPKFAELVNGIDVQGEAELSGNVSGIYNENSMPKIAAKVALNRGKAAVEGVPYKLHDVQTEILANIDLNKYGVSEAKIEQLSAKTGSNSVKVSGKIDDLLGKMRCNLAIRGDVNLPELAPILPEDLRVDLQGRTKIDLKTQFALDDALAMKLEKINANGSLIFNELDVKYNDSIFVKTPELTLNVTLPSTHKNRSFKEMLAANITSPELKIEMLGTLDAAISDAKFDIATGNILNTTQMLTASCAFDMQHLVANMDTINAEVMRPSGKITLAPSRRNKKNPRLTCQYSSDKLSATMGCALDVKTNFVKIDASTTYDETQENHYLKWNPTLKIDFNDGKIRMANVQPTIEIPAIKFAFTPRNLTIDDSRIVIDRSDFALKGEVKNIRKFMKKEGLLEGEISFNSEQTDINQLMDLVNGFGNETDEMAAEQTAENQQVAEKEDNPFMVPKGIDLTLNTQIKNAIFADNQLQNIAGKLTVKDGVLVLEQMGFTCDAAEMQLTAMYRSERRNHLFAGLDFHLLNIDIERLIHMVPDIDTIFPMLKSFEGRAEFHLAAETYLKSNYDIKFSTLRGATAIEGHDLVLLDSETFGKIAKPLLFNRKTKNLVDSISVEATIFRDEVDLYPFVMSMDKYSAVVGGRYDLGNNYNAHIETLSPIRLALQIKGNASDLDNMSFKLVKTKYGDMYKPERRNATQERTLALKKLISDALKRNVK